MCLNFVRWVVCRKANIFKDLRFGERRVIAAAAAAASLVASKTEQFVASDQM